MTQQMINKLGWENIKGTIWLIGIITSIGISFAVSQYKISELEIKVTKLDEKSETIIRLQEKMENMQKNMDELTKSNKEIYNLLLDMSKDRRNNGYNR